MKKKILSLVLTVAMLLSALTVMTTTAMAADGSAEVTTIATYADLENFIASLANSSYDGKTVTVTANITGNETFNAMAETVAAPANVLTTADNTFKGTFDGNGKAFKNIYIKGNSLFGNLDGATIQNLTLENCYLTKETSVDTRNQASAGYIASKATGNATISNITIKGCKAYDTWDALGGIVGTVNASVTVGITNCKNLDGAMYIASSDGSALLGGMVGTSSGTLNLTDCENSSYLWSMSNVNRGGCKVGGMIANPAAGTTTILRCANRANIDAYSQAGGIAGDNRTTLNITDSLNTGAITAGEATYTSSMNCFAGGMVAQNYSSNGRITISGCVNTGAVKATINHSTSGIAGGAVGAVANNALTVKDFVNTGAITAHYKAGGVVGKHQLVDGIFERIISFGKVTGYNGSNNNATVNAGASCVLIGMWGASNTAHTAYVTVNDLYYNSKDNTNIFGVWTNLGSTNGDYNAAYTKDNATIEFRGGTTNAATDGVTANTQGKNLALYNQFFYDYGRIYDITTVYGAKAATKFGAFEIGDKWMLTETVPMPTGVQKLLNKTAETNANINYKGVQESVGSDTSDVRLVADVLADITQYQKVGFDIQCVEENRYVVTAPEDKVEGTTVYTSINICNANGDVVDTVRAEEGKYLAALVVKEVPTTGTYTFVVKPYLIAIGKEAPADGETGAAFAVVVVNGVIKYSYAM